MAQCQRIKINPLVLDSVSGRIELLVYSLEHIFQLTKKKKKEEELSFITFYERKV